MPEIVDAQMLHFEPAIYLRNPHLQTLLGTSRLRLQQVMQRCQPILKLSTSTVLRASDGTRLQAEYLSNPQGNHKLAVLLHGWEGSANSAYILGCSQALYNLGYSVARLNLRDHGDTHHLNQSPFNSARLNEVAEAIVDLTRRHPHQGLVLLGFSLGGNFVLRLSTQPSLHEMKLEKSIAICPAIDPLHTSQSLENGHPVYHRHFLKKWRNSLEKKYRYYPEIMRSPGDLKIDRLQKMNAVFVPLHTGFNDPKDFLDAYRITQKTLDAIPHRCEIIFSDDDPIINADDYDQLHSTANVTLHIQQYGGHCAFLQDWHLGSWIENILPELVQQ